MSTTRSNKTPITSETQETAETEQHAITRRALLGMLGATGLVIVTGCGGGSSATSAGTTTTGTGTTGTTTTTGTGTTGTTTTGTVTPEGEIGPYFTDDSASAYNRSNILTSIDGTNAQAGIPLTLKIYVYDTQNSNAPLTGAQVDIWHCNALGVYSNESSENTLGQTWLRGYQTTDANGYVTFMTIVPGWYQGRTTHIHLRVRSKYSEASSTSDGANTTQLFFAQALLNTINTTVSPYSSHGTNPTTNTNDHVYTPETLGETELTLTGDTSGYTSTFSVYLPITKE